MRKAMFWPKFMLAALLALPFAELAVFIAVAAAIGFGYAVLLVLATSFAGAMLLRHGGRVHVARLRVVMGPQRIHAMHADASGLAVLVCGILLLIPGFITDVAGVVLLIPALRRGLGRAFRRAAEREMTAREAVVDLKPGEWQRVPQRRLPERD
jgi:UPF0716 protein FxsA